MDCITLLFHCWYVYYLEIDDSVAQSFLHGANTPLSSLINQKLKTVTKRIIGEYQYGFHPNKSTTDQLFIIRQMMEKHYAHGLNLCVVY
jgi:hypothetical protein